jgi:hypothetical protein
MLLRELFCYLKKAEKAGITQFNLLLANSGEETVVFTILPAGLVGCECQLYFDVELEEDTCSGSVEATEVAWDEESWDKFRKQTTGQAEVAPNGT